MRKTYPTVLVVGPLCARFLDGIPRRGRDRPTGRFGSTNGADGEAVHAGDDGVLGTALDETANKVGGFSMSDEVLGRKEVDIGLCLLENMRKKGSRLRV